MFGHPVGTAFGTGRDGLDDRMTRDGTAAAAISLICWHRSATLPQLPGAPARRPAPTLALGCRRRVLHVALLVRDGTGLRVWRASVRGLYRYVDMRVGYFDLRSMFFDVPGKQVVGSVNEK